MGKMSGKFFRLTFEDKFPEFESKKYFTKKIKKIINKKVKNTEIKNMLNSYYDFR